ncbi:MAG: hypothetical protein GF388_04845 [Candidatus Aegiribacteria sp.]|nr:hypothetical protein [Candidatus Aegiribacteria sp.]
MSWEVLYNERTDTVELINTGTFTPEDLFREVPVAYRLARKNGTGRYLVDGSEREVLAVSHFDYYDVPKVLEGFELDEDTKIAMVLPHGQDSDEGMTFFETICLNRGYNARIFKSREEAEAWLNSQLSGSD